MKNAITMNESYKGGEICKNHQKCKVCNSLGFATFAQHDWIPTLQALH
jgi:hypothetical protein